MQAGVLPGSRYVEPRLPIACVDREDAGGSACRGRYRPIFNLIRTIPLAAVSVLTFS